MSSGRFWLDSGGFGSFLAGFRSFSGRFWLGLGGFGSFLAGFRSFSGRFWLGLGGFGWFQVVSDFINNGLCPPPSQSCQPAT